LNSGANFKNSRLFLVSLQSGGASTTKAGKTMNPNQSDIALREWRLHQKADALGELLKAQRNRAFGIALGIVRSPADAEDVVQEAFIKLMSRTHGFDGMAAFELAVYRAVAQCAMDALRKQKRRSKHEVADGMDGADVMKAARIPKVANHAQALEHAEARAALRNAVAELPDDERAAVALCFEQGMSISQTAQTMDMARDTVRAKLSRALACLRQRLKKGGHDSGAAMLAFWLWQDGAVKVPDSLCQALDRLLPGRPCAEIEPKAPHIGPSARVDLLGLEQPWYQGTAVKVAAVAALALLGVGLFSMKNRERAASAVPAVARPKMEHVPTIAPAMPTAPVAGATAVADTKTSGAASVPAPRPQSGVTEREAKEETVKNKFGAAVLAMSILAMASSRAADQQCQQCPCLQAAESVGASKETFAKIEKLRNECMASVTKINQSSEFQKVLAAAKAAPHDKAVQLDAQKKLNDLCMPAFAAFHKGAKEVFGETYPKFVEKLPPAYRVGAVASK
jgi:RNA polymerase sigma-70 factor (ECF subfamily)